MKSLETERLILRQWEPEDAGFVLDLYSRWEVQQFIGNPPQVMTDLQQAEERIRVWRATDHPGHGAWSVQIKATGELAGALLLKSIPASGGSLPLQLRGH
ncbi:GNAT family N-acetyltransferase [Arthrobacter nitrophenolicus]|uniref:GNAT family N-acetyltransferase n=1 Tax=Arthrobacter nitrophenolicus TaxID=683150 RepID=UPI002284CE7C|nr:GNAT family N-acetyltransferase [Arthrobacter nitrophenolicus]